jgi:hypothetical protein
MFFVGIKGSASARAMSLFKDYDPDESQDLLHYYKMHCHPIAIGSGEGQNLLPP